MNQIVKYPGSKWSKADWILSYFPQHHSYLDAFFGSGALLFKKSRSNIETVNDLDGDVVNFFEILRSDPERLATELYFTPYARQVYEDAYKHPKDNFERAVKFYIRCNMGHGIKTTGEKVGWKNDVQGREHAYAAKLWCNLPTQIIQVANRLRGVQIENRPAIELIERFNYPSVLIYADPPYVLDTRHGKQYRHEMTNKDHHDLLDALKAHKGPVIISGYESDIYNDALTGWHKETSVAYAQNATKRQEVLWMNFEPQQQLKFEI